VRPRAAGRLGREIVAVREHAHHAVRRDRADVDFDDEVDDDAQTAQQVGEVGEAREDLVEFEVVRLRRRFDEIVREVGSLAPGAVVEAVRLEERVHGLLRCGWEVRAGHVLEDHPAVPPLPLPSAGELLVERTRVRNPGRDRAERQERSQEPKRVIEGWKLGALRGRRTVGLLEELE
jgi:hypothetical protein